MTVECPICCNDKPPTDRKPRAIDDSRTWKVVAKALSSRGREGVGSGANSFAAGNLEGIVTEGVTVQAARESWGIAGALLYNGESDPPFSPAPQPEISPAEIWAAEMPPEFRSQTREIRLHGCTARVLPVFFASVH